MRLLFVSNELYKKGVENVIIGLCVLIREEKEKLLLQLCEIWDL